MKNLLLSILILLTIVSCSKESQNEVTVYTTVDQIFSEPILNDFETETGIKVKAIFDTEETKSTGVLNRIIAEKDNPHCDVFWSGDPIRAIVLKNQGITRAYDSPSARGIAENFKDKEHHWIGFSARARVLIYNKKLLKAEDVPASIFDLSKAKYRGNFAIANPLFGTTSFHFSSLFSTLGEHKAKKLLSDFKENNVLIATSNGDVKKRVLNGEIACGLTDTDDAFVAMEESADIGIVFLDQKGIGSLIMPNSVSLMKNSPHTSNGKRLIDYLLTKETERKLAISSAQMPLHKGMKIPTHVPSLDNIVAMKIDYEKSSKKLEEIQEYLKKWGESY